MAQFIGRQAEISGLNRLYKDSLRQAQFVIMYGRRRVGKTTLLLHWAQQTGQPFLYWVARRETPDALRQSLAAALWNWAYPGGSNQPPIFTNWEILFREMARLIGDKPLILIWDEFSYAAESDPTFPSHLQAAWDHILKELPIMLILSGSHIGMMVDMMNYQAPLYGRFTAQFPVDPLPYSAMASFFPAFSAPERVSVYACLGGIPAYLERFDPEEDLSANIRRHLFSRSGMFRSEPSFLVSDLVRETRIYETILRAVANGKHTPAEISQYTGINASNFPPYMKRMIELRLLERRIPATIPFAQRETTTRSRYRVNDPFLRFYYRFVEPNLEMIEQGQVDALWQRVNSQFRAFVGMTTFEELCQEWVTRQAQLHQLPFTPELVGSHWSGDAQIDVVAINWQEKSILLGECKWGLETVGRGVVQELMAKTGDVVPGKDWKVYYALFSRTGFTAPARDGGEDTLFVDLAEIDALLCQDTAVRFPQTDLAI